VFITDKILINAGSKKEGNNLQQLHTVNVSNTDSSKARLLYFVRADCAPAGFLSTLSSLDYGQCQLGNCIAPSQSSATVFLLCLSG